MVAVRQIGNFSESKRSNPNTNRVYDKSGLSPALNTMQGGNRQPMIIEDFYKNRDARVYEEVAPSLRSERSGLKTVEEIVINDRGFKEKSPQVSIEISPTLRAETHGNLPKVVIEKDKPLLDEKIKIKQATKQGFIECKAGGVADFSYPTSKLRRGRVQGGGEISPTLTSTTLGVCKVESRYRIRKLTPKECWRLMGFSDSDFEKAAEVNSNTQLYKEAGNSIVKDVLMAIFRQMNIRGVEPWNK